MNRADPFASQRSGLEFWENYFSVLEPQERVDEETPFVPFTGEAPYEVPEE